MANNLQKLGEFTPDNLIASIHVKQRTCSGTITAGAGEVKRGAVLAQSENGKLVIMAGGRTPYGVMCDTVTVGDADEVVEVYLTGCFNHAALNEATGYELTAADIQALRNGGIFIENVMEK